MLRPEFFPLLYKTGRLCTATAKQAYLSARQRNLIALCRVGEILDAAAKRGVTLLPLKGVLFADVLYDDVGLRPMSDVDLAVRPSELAAASEVMTALGFVRAQPPGKRFSPRHAHDLSFVDRTGLVIELHHRLVHELGVDADLEAMFARAVTTDFLGARRPVPDLSDHLFFVLLHAATHGYYHSLIWLCDAALLLAAGVDVTRAAEEARRRRAQVAFSAGLAIGHRLLPGRLPPPSTALAPARRAFLAVVFGPCPERREIASLQWRVVRLALTDRPLDAARELWRKSSLRLLELAEK